MQSDFEEILKAFTMLDPIPVIEIEYRIHYDENGDIRYCSTHNHPENTTYIVVTEEEYNEYFRYKVVNGKLEKIVHDQSRSEIPLVKSDSGYRVVKNNASLVLEEHEECTNVEYYGTRNS